MGVKELEKNPSQHNGTLIKGSNSVKSSHKKQAYIEGYDCML